MTFVAFDGTYQEVECTGQSRASYELLRSAKPLVGPGKIIDKLAITTFTGKLQPQYAVDGFPIIKMGLEVHLAIWGNMIGMFNLANRIKPAPDAIYWHTPVRFCGDVPGIRQAVMVHDLAPLRKPDAYPRRARWLLSNAMKRMRNSTCRILSISEVTKNDIVELADIPPERVTVVHNGVSDEFRLLDEAVLAETAAKLGLTDKRFLLFVGRPSPRKNVPMLLEIFLQARRQSGDTLHLVLIGPGHGAIDGICDKLGFTQEERDAVIILSRVSEDELVAVYNLAWSLVFPTTYEGFGLPVIEAMACGTPVISSDCSSIPEVAGDAAILLDPAGPQPWIDAIVALQDDQAHWQELRRRGLIQAATMTWDRAAEQILNILAED